MLPKDEIRSSSAERDLFISYSSKDRLFVERLAQDLNRYGVKVWIDTLEMRVGDSLNKKIQEGISSSGWLGIVLSPDSVASRWVEKELNAALELELEKQSVFVLPLLYRDCTIPLFLRDKVYADFRISYESGREALLNRLNPEFEPAILKVLMSGPASVTKAAFVAIPPEKRSLYEAKLQQSLSSSSVSERTAAITALFAIRREDALTYLTQMASDPSASVRRYAVFYLGELRSRKALGILSERMSDSSPNVRDSTRRIQKDTRCSRIVTASPECSRRLTPYWSHTDHPRIHISNATPGQSGNPLAKSVLLDSL